MDQPSSLCSLRYRTLSDVRRRYHDERCRAGVVRSDRSLFRFALFLLFAIANTMPTLAKEPEQSAGLAPQAGFVSKEETATSNLQPHEALSEQKWREVDLAVEKGIAFLAGQQSRNGCFSAFSDRQPAITALCAMSFLSAGHLPDQPPYGQHLDRAVTFILQTQSTSGLLCLAKAEPYLNRVNSWDPVRAHALYNHAIAGVFLCEVYGMVPQWKDKSLRTAIERALKFSRTLQINHKPNNDGYGGWRYMFNNSGIGADLSVTSWQLMFYRAAKNAGFDVPQQHIDDAMDFVRSCYEPSTRNFRYSVIERRLTRAMNGAGILSLSLAGEHQTEMAQSAGDWVAKQSFQIYNHDGGFVRDQYNYSVYYCTLGMLQLGGERWQKFFPPVADVLLRNQSPDGSWPPEAQFVAGGSTYSTALNIMVLTAADQLIPIYQR